MGYNIISAAEAATYVKHGYNVGLSGFTPAGSPKAVTPEIAKIAEAEHAAGRPFQIGIFTGASTGDSADGALIRAKALRYRAPYTTNADFRKAVNNGEVAYNDIHLSQMAQELRYGYYGKLNVAIIEACHVTPDGRIYLTAGGGISPTIARLADHIIIELNAAHRGTQCLGLHDVYEPIDPPYRREIPVYKPSDRIGAPYLQVDPKKIVGIVEVNIPDEARGFTAPDPITDKIGHNVADFLLADMKRGIIPSTFLPLQSGVGNIANAVLGALGSDKNVPAFEMYTEVLDEQSRCGEGIDQAQHIRLVGDAEVAVHLILFDIGGIDADDDLRLVAHGEQHPDLGIRCKSRQNTAGMEVIKQLSAQLQIQLLSELRNAFSDVSGLLLNIFIVVESDFLCHDPHIRFFSVYSVCVIFVSLTAKNNTVIL